jgi:hypothetical protein
MKIYGQVYEQPTPAGVNVRYSLNRVEDDNSDYVSINIDATQEGRDGYWGVGHISLPLSMWERIVKDFGPPDLGDHPDLAEKLLTDYDNLVTRLLELGDTRMSHLEVEAQALWSRWHSPGTTVPGWNILLREQNGGKTLHFENLEQLTEYVQSLPKG